MSQAVKQRKALQRETLTINKVVNGVNKIQQAKAKNNPVEKARQAYQMSLATRPLGNY